MNEIEAEIFEAMAQAANSGPDGERAVAGIAAGLAAAVRLMREPEGWHAVAYSRGLDSVSFDNLENAWRAYKDTVYLGGFSTPAEAFAAIAKARGT